MERKWKVIVADKIPSACLSFLEEQSDVVVVPPELDTDELRLHLKDASAVIVRSRTTIGEELLVDAPELKVIGRAGAGVDNIDLAAAKAKDILVMNTPGANAISTAEQTIGLILSIARHIPQAYNSMREGRWDKSKYKGIEIFQKNLGILGLGRVGREVAVRAKALGMNILGYSPNATPEKLEALGGTLMTPEEILQQADILTLHMPSNEETKGFINQERLSKCKRGMYIVNCARGNLIEYNALFEALESGVIAGCALDVFDHEPLNADSPLRTHPLVITTPHLAASTKEAQDRVSKMIIDQILHFFRTGEAQNTVG